MSASATLFEVFVPGAYARFEYRRTTRQMHLTTVTRSFRVGAFVQQEETKHRVSRRSLGESIVGDLRLGMDFKLCSKPIPEALG